MTYLIKGDKVTNRDYIKLEIDIGNYIDTNNDLSLIEDSDINIIEYLDIYFLYNNGNGNSDNWLSIGKLLIKIIKNMNICEDQARLLIHELSVILKEKSRFIWKRLDEETFWIMSNLNQLLKNNANIKEFRDYLKELKVEHKNYGYNIRVIKNGDVFIEKVTDLDKFINDSEVGLILT